MTDRLQAYIQLMRADRPIGTYLLLWPTLCALWLAAGGIPQRANLLIFVLGVWLMRSAGCVINDFADRRVDGHVERTRNRPLATGRVSGKEAVILFVVLSLIAFGLVLQTNSYTVELSFVALGLAFCYPFMKRFTHLPQVVLGAAFGWGIPMAFAAESNHVPLIGWLLFLANLTWTVAYDTFYAMVDRNDDELIGVKSTAILFGRYDRLIIAVLQGITIWLLAVIGELAGLGSWYGWGLVIAMVLFVWQHWHTRHRERQACFRAFLHNHWVGMAIFVGLLLDTWPTT
ncbi:4-hydroxybenzoate polyprenyltransferase [Pokkaliibacter plantistimulans]|uniref:4-hydroxybenzoate octaprenyltransferase n=1 Tax=Pokkaliibacter plantistimulans TaxID=1635171 RepID=A0ABX5M069_9GAMM|nr:4-hydroxybenzoate octaprenyltransferase [Pokkaliibacter plantistimulans]PXF31118.1 4-hydroxybenzoate polyprenyltransferase [Pokkaliibacter plantistimulans]